MTFIVIKCTYTSSLSIIKKYLRPEKAVLIKKNRIYYIEVESTIVKYHN